MHMLVLNKISSLEAVFISSIKRGLVPVIVFFKVLRCLTNYAIVLSWVFEGPILSQEADTQTVLRGAALKDSVRIHEIFWVDSFYSRPSKDLSQMLILSKLWGLAHQ